MLGIVKTISQEEIDEMLSIVKTAQLTSDVSSYARGRQRIWLNMNWDLKKRKFDRDNDCFRDDRLWSMILNVWPEAEIGLLTYSGDKDPKGIFLHRDDSYADNESWGIQLTGTCKFVYMDKVDKSDPNNSEEIRQELDLNPGDVFRFDCKCRHSAVPSTGRYAINLWKISKKFRRDYEDANRPKAKPLF